MSFYKHSDAQRYGDELKRQKNPSEIKKASPSEQPKKLNSVLFWTKQKLIPLWRRKATGMNVECAENFHIRIKILLDSASKVSDFEMETKSLECVYSSQWLLFLHCQDSKIFFTHIQVWRLMFC